MDNKKSKDAISMVIFKESNNLSLSAIRKKILSQMADINNVLKVAKIKIINKRETFYFSASFDNANIFNGSFSITFESDNIDDLEMLGKRLGKKKYLIVISKS